MLLTPTKKINIADRFTIGGNERFVLLAGPCAIESEEMTLETAQTLKEICGRLGIHLVFKSSFDKANRSSVKSPRGVGLQRGLQILDRVRSELDLPVITDVHEPWQCAQVAEVADMLQIPAFLSRQTDLLVAAARTGKAVNVKKGQFMAPWDMKNVVNKLCESGNENILLCERGSCFGYNNLVVDMTGLVEMRQYGFPVVFDATHSVQKPGGQGDSTGGNREMIPYLMRAALAVGVDAIFAEVHPDPDHAFSDGPNQIQLARIEEILKQAILVDNITKELPREQETANPNVQQASTAKPSGKRIKLLLTDVDGVLTDGGMYYSNSGDELKKFNAHDGMGLQFIRQRGIKTGIVTSETTALVERRFNKLQLDFLVQGQRGQGKLNAIKEICAREGIALHETAYIGDDVNCLETLSAVGLAACPHDAVNEIKQVPGIIRMNAKGGEGCVREFVELILSRYL